MPLHRLPVGGPMPECWDLDEGRLARLPVIEDPGAEARALRDRGGDLRRVPTDSLLALLDGLADRWLATRPGELRAMGDRGIAFVLAFLRRAHLEPRLRASLRGHLDALDRFVQDPDLGVRVRAVPRGVVTHWLAGNAPLLGLLSLVQSALARNVSVAKVPREAGLLLPWIWGWLADTGDGDEGRRAAAAALADSVSFVYCSPGDHEAQAALSLASDARVAWGGREAVEAVTGLPRATWAEDVIFGPKLSLAVIGRHSLDEESLARVADAIAFDASLDDQRGCHSPHVVFVERGGAIEADRFARALAAAMERALARVPKPPVPAAEAYRIVSVRAEWALSGAVHASTGPAWTVICSEAAGLESACGGRVVFVRPVARIEDVLPMLGPAHQAVGLLVDADREASFAEAAAARGIARLVRPGQMARFDYPWDGLFPIDRLVRWVSLG